MRNNRIPKDSGLECRGREEEETAYGIVNGWNEKEQDPQKSNRRKCTRQIIVA